ncbi:MAG: hypothetical protein WD844_08005 [Thermoleophilaceae bacterium]
MRRWPTMIALAAMTLAAPTARAQPTTELRACGEVEAPGYYITRLAVEVRKGDTSCAFARRLIRRGWSEVVADPERWACYAPAAGDPWDLICGLASAAADRAGGSTARPSAAGPTDDGTVAQRSEAVVVGQVVDQRRGPAGRRRSRGRRPTVRAFRHSLQGFGEPGPRYGVRVTARFRACAVRGRLLVRIRERKTLGGEVFAERTNRWRRTHRRRCGMYTFRWRLRDSFFGVGRYQLRVIVTDRYGRSSRARYTSHFTSD